MWSADVLNEDHVVLSHDLLDRDAGDLSEVMIENLKITSPKNCYSTKF